jgi:hypothetical protein
MIKLSQYRTMLGFFAIGLLWLVSEVIGDETKPGPLDSATKSMVHRLHEPASGGSDEAGTDYELAVSEAIPREATAPHRSAWSIEPDSPAASSGEAASGPQPGSPVQLIDAEAGESRAEQPDVGVIHK